MRVDLTPGSGYLKAFANPGLVESLLLQLSAIKPHEFIRKQTTDVPYHQPNRRSPSLEKPEGEEQTKQTNKQETDI